jgi:hypothetical protein
MTHQLTTGNAKVFCKRAIEPSRKAKAAAFWLQKRLARMLHIRF